MVKHRNNRSVLWNYFTSNNKDKLAECNICFNRVSFKTTSANLKTHLRRRHIRVYEQMMGESLLNEKKESEKSQLNSDDEASSSASILQKWFEKHEDDDDEVVCVKCRTYLPSNLTDMTEHLANVHSEVIFESESDNEHDKKKNGTYSEVVYLDEEFANTKNVKRTSENNNSKIDVPMKKIMFNLKRRKMSNADSTPLNKPKFTEYRNDKQIPKSRPRNNETDIVKDEVNSFGTYITCLLKQLPKDVCTRLQLEMIKIVMVEKLNQEMPTSVLTQTTETTEDNMDQNNTEYHKIVNDCVNTSDEIEGEVTVTTDS